MNPLDFAKGRCNCKPPVSQKEEMVDWTMDNFYTLSMEEWLEINEKNQPVVDEVFEGTEEEVTELASSAGQSQEVGEPIIYETEEEVTELNT